MKKISNILIDNGTMSVNRTTTGYIARFKDGKGNVMRLPNGQEAYTFFPFSSNVNDRTIEGAVISRLSNGITFGGKSGGIRDQWILSLDGDGNLRLKAEQEIQTGLFDSSPADLSDPETRKALRGAWISDGRTELDIAGFIRKNGEWCVKTGSSVLSAQDLLERWHFLPGGEEISGQGILRRRGM